VITWYERVRPTRSLAVALLIKVARALRAQVFGMGYVVRDYFEFECACCVAGDCSSPRTKAVSGSVAAAEV